MNDNGEEIKGEREEEEEGQCGLCLFMKGDGCKDNCVKEVEKSKEYVVDNCFEATNTHQQRGGDLD
ncbi:hypothetical protein Ddye_013323 [Dipteronia dyeriana]|uniref:GCK domain-containing protein n=1 Tax=Dipteronia dyeriana TaxID=168575 RepID=A0AAD9X677_9ROSI|nr:hypothetical protein Ddye_013323 [Dipteronia dyeriana]